MTPLWTCPTTVQKDGDKVLSDNNYTDAEKSKLGRHRRGRKQLRPPLAHRAV